VSLTLLGLALVAFGVTLAVIAPASLGMPRFVSQRPRTAMLAWTATLLVGSTFILVGLLLMIGVALSHHVEHVPAHSATIGLIESVLGWIAVAVLGFVAFRIGVAVSELRAQQSSADREIVSLLASGTATIIDDREVLRVTWSRPFVVASPQQNQVLFSSALEDALTAVQLSAALAHEWAHIDQRHAALLAIGRVTSSALPFVRANERMMQVMRISTELEADDIASRKCGRDATMAALRVAYPYETGVLERIERIAAFTNK
jgi:hypothetical protein